jgi:hypothetical protein
MRLSSLLLTASTAALLAVAAAAQDAPPPAPAEQPATSTEQPPATAEPSAAGLSDLRDTVQGLQDDQQPPAETPAPTPSPPPPPPPPAPAPAPTTAPTPPPPAAPRYNGPIYPLTRTQLAALDAAVVRGRTLAAIARGGQVATQDMLARVPNPDAAGITGWIAEPEGNAVTVTFYAAGADGAAPVAVYRGSVLGTRVVSRETYVSPEGRPALTALQRRMAAARHVAEGTDHHACGADEFNYFVVPPTTPEGPIDVYQMSPQSQRGHFPIGGHFKTTVNVDGSIAATRGFTNSCLDVATVDPAPGAQPEPIAVTHLLDPLPTEVHVFLAIWTRHPLVVVAGDPQRLFAVTDDRIAEIPRGAGR